MYKPIRVNIFEVSAVLELDVFRFQETKPMYAAMIQGADSYFCFSEELENLPRALVQAAGPDYLVIPTNLKKIEYFRRMNFGDSAQCVEVKHKPLSPSDMERLISSAIHGIAPGKN